MPLPSALFVSLKACFAQPPSLHMNPHFERGASVTELVAGGSFRAETASAVLNRASTFDDGEGARH